MPFPVPVATQTPFCVFRANVPLTGRRAADPIVGTENRNAVALVGQSNTPVPVRSRGDCRLPGFVGRPTAQYDAAAEITADDVLRERTDAPPMVLSWAVPPMNTPAPAFPNATTPKDVGSNEAVEHLLVAAGIADDGDAVAAVGGNGVLENDGDLEPADDVVVGVAVDEDSVGPVRQGQSVSAGVHADDVFGDLNTGGVAGNVNAVAQVPEITTGAQQVVAAGRCDEEPSSSVFRPQCP